MKRARVWNRVFAVAALILPTMPAMAQGDSLDSLLGPATDPVTTGTEPPKTPETNPADAGSVPVPATPTASTEASPKAAETIPVETSNAAAPVKAATPARARNRLVEEIVVTANRREENVQDVPQSVTAFSNDKLEAAGVQTVQDLPNITPGLTITNQAGYNQVFLRGVGTDAFLPGADASVPFYVDGIPLLGTQGSSDALGKIQRVEVLKGPQGTLFGANSVGGAINIVTPDPTHDFNGDVQVGFGNYNAKKGAAYVNIPIGSSLAASITAYGSQQDNFYVNDAGDVIDVYSYGARGKLLWDITSDLHNTVSLSYNKMSNNAGLTFENTLPAPRIGGFSPIPADPKADRHVSYPGFTVGAVNHSYLIADTLQWQLPYADFKAIGSYQNLTSDNVSATFGAGSLALAQQASANTQYTGELQFLSNADTPFHDHFTWVAGAFYTYSKGGFDPFKFILAPGLVNAITGTYLGTTSPLITGINSLLAPITGAAGLNLNDGIVLYNRGVIDTSSSSGYFQGTFAITDSFNVILGGRYQYTRKQLITSTTSYADANAPGGEVLLISDTLPVLHSYQFSSRVGLQYRIDDTTQAYASWARGYKTPTYNTVNLLGSTLEPITPVLAQRNDAFEVGLKTELFDQTLRINSSLFYTREKDLLTGTVQVLSGGIVNYDNAPAARIFGAETDVVWSPLPDRDPGLAITLSGAYLNAKYTDYPNGRGYDPGTGLAYGPGNVLPLLPARDQTGNDIPRTPDFTGNLGLGQTLPVTDGSVELGVDGSYNSGFYWSAQNAQIERTNSYYLLNAHATYMYDPWSVEVEAYVKNLTDVTYIQTVFVDDFGRSVILNDPRTFGFRLKWKFG